MAIPASAIAAKIGAAARSFLIAGKIGRGFDFGQETIHLDSSIDSIQFEVKGLKTLQKQLKEMAITLRSKLVRAALLKAIHVVEQEAKKLAPVKTGTLKRAIKSRVEKRGSSKDPLGFDEYGVRLYVEHGKAAQNDAYYARWVELGTKPYKIPKKNFGERKKPLTNFDEKGEDATWFGTNIEMPKKPERKHAFMRPAMDNKRKEAVRKFRDELGKEIEKSLRRAKGKT